MMKQTGYWYESKNKLLHVENKSDVPKGKLYVQQNGYKFANGNISNEVLDSNGKSLFKIKGVNPNKLTPCEMLNIVVKIQRIIHKILLKDKYDENKFISEVKRTEYDKHCKIK